MAATPFFPAAGVLPDSTLLFCDGPVWVGVRVDGVDGAEILRVFDRLRRYVVVAASRAPRQCSIAALTLPVGMLPGALPPRFKCETVAGCKSDDCWLLERCQKVPV